jgi:hypothetical protein
MCSDSQLGVYRIVNGRAEAKCFDLPQVVRRDEFRARILGIALEREVDVSELIERPELRRAFETRSLNFEGERLTLSLPSGKPR